jgi:hypothetical protein
MSFRASPRELNRLAGGEEATMRNGIDHLMINANDYDKAYALCLADAENLPPRPTASDPR